MFALWREDSLGQAVLVRDIFKQPSYWLVPVVLQKRILGFIRISGLGSIEAIGTSCRDAENLQSCPIVETGITKQEALQFVRKNFAFEKNETLAEPTFIHDGSKGREVWLIEVQQDKKVVRWIFVTAGGSYERPAGMILKEDIE